MTKRSEVEKIVLPCGVVLTRKTFYEHGDADYACGPEDDIWIHAYADGLAMAGHGSGAMDADVPLADAISWLDSRVVELRRALMPPDAREIVARALFDHEDMLAGEGITLAEQDESCIASYLETADAVLAALGGGK